MLGYRPGSFGPHSDAVDASLGRLVGAGMIGDSLPMSLTDGGRPGYEAARGEIGDHDMRLLESSKAFINSMGHDPMLAYIYSMYPGMSAESDRYGDIMAGREGHIVGLVNDGIISSRCGAGLMGAEYADFLLKIDMGGA